MDTLLEKMMDAKKSREIVHVSFFNDGKIREDDREFAKNIKDAYDIFPDYAIEYFLCNAAKAFSDTPGVDSVSVGMSLGLIYNKEDVDDNNKIIEGAEPIKNVVRYYTETVTGYSNGEVVRESRDTPIPRQGYTSFSKLISMINKGGLYTNCPKTFDEFKKAILSGEKFDISIYADLREKESTKEKPKSFVKSLFK